MGHNTMKLANGPLYRNVQGLDFRVLMYLAQVTLDHDTKRSDIPARTYFGGIAPIVEHIYDVTPDAEEYRARYSTIQKSMRRLVEIDAIRRTRKGVGQGTSEYEICPLQGML
jgi:hypothetical protein